MSITSCECISLTPFSFCMLLVRTCMCSKDDDVGRRFKVVSITDVVHNSFFDTANK